jgi:hypothetical protein
LRAPVTVASGRRWFSFRFERAVPATKQKERRSNMNAQLQSAPQVKHGGN